MSDDTAGDAGTTDTPNAETWVFTFGFGHTHPRTGRSLANHYVRVPGTYEQARARMLERFGNRWAFQYETVEMARGRGHHELTELPFTSYEPGELRPPTDTELAAGVWPLETIDVGNGTAWNTPFYPTFAQVHRMFTEYNIPHAAHIDYGDCGSHTIIVVWDV